MVWKLILALVALVIVIGVICAWRMKKTGAADMRDDEENVVDLNDRFNRARQMDRDGN